MTSQANTIQALIKPKCASPLKYKDTSQKAFKFLNFHQVKATIHEPQDKHLNRLDKVRSEAIVNWNRFNRVR